MRNILIVVLSLILGAGATYFLLKPEEGQRIASLRFDKVTWNKIDILQTRDFSNVVFETSTPNFAGVTAVVYSAWDYRVLIGLNFDDFEPEKKLTGLDKPNDRGIFEVSGTLPPIKIVNSSLIDGSDEEIILSKAAGRSENELLLKARSRRSAYNECVKAYALSQVDPDVFMEQFVTKLQYFMPKNAAGASLVSFDLAFEETEPPLLNKEFQELGLRKVCTTS